MNIYLGARWSETDYAALTLAAKGDTVWFAENVAEPTTNDQAALATTEIVIGSVPFNLLPTAKMLRWVQLLSVGIDGYGERNRIAAHPTSQWTNLGGILADPIAQTILAGLLALDRGIDQLVRCQLRQDWQKSHLHPRLHVLRGAQVLLLGGGSVTRRLRELLEPFGCKFTVYARTSGDINTCKDLDDAIRLADLVVAALPDTLATRQLLDARRIALFRKSALFVNVGRGSLVDEGALLGALQGGHLRGAVLDVTAREPLPPGDPLWHGANLILTQHTAAGSTGLMSDVLGFVTANLHRYRSGQRLQGQVDWSRGY